jgi:hypothetical protein
METDSLSVALQFLAGGVCLQIGGDTFAKCRPITFSPLPEIREDSLCTWLCEDTHFFTLFKSESDTLIYSHTNEILYHASMQAQLASTCPNDISFICQFTFDTLPEGKTPRLLVFDVLPQNNQNNPIQRGEILRSTQGLPQPLCCVQWIGFHRYLTPLFFAALPHPVRGVCVLGDDPLTVSMK